MTEEMADRRRWTVLAVGLLGLIAGCAAQYGLAFLIPAMRAEGTSLETASLLVTAPIAGIMCTLIAWGAAADRWGERRILALGLAGAGVAEIAAASVDGVVAQWLLVFVVGATSASIHSASGRLILGWFGAPERGLAMGIRQMGLPLGIGAAALVLPALAVDGIGPALLAVGAACLVTAALITVIVRDPARPSVAAGADSASPYRQPYLWRIHAASGLLVIPQIAVAVFAFDYLVNGLGWSTAPAGLLVASTQVAGALTRLVAGWWSDRAGSRLGPMRLVAITIGASMTVLAGLGLAQVPIAVAALAVAGVVTLTPNGLAFTAVAERAGPRWAGKALGVQNTFQNAIGALVPIPLALVIGAAGGEAGGYALAFAAVVLFPFVAALVIPASSEARLQ
ncbi:MAG: MFS transporter [Candidatus Limnocylindria bacterium]